MSPIVQRGARSLVGAFRLPGVAWSFSRLGYRRRARSFRTGDLEVSLAGKQYAVTGANSGIGFAIAEAWARRGADVWMLCRDRQRGRAAHERLRDVGPGTVHLELIDLADARSIDDFLARAPIARLDGLVHNAGALVHEFRALPEGLESTFACHVVGPQRLTHGLASALAAAGDARVVFVSSGGMYSERLQVAGLLSPARPFDGVKAYALAKRAQVVLTEQWAARHAFARFYAMHPGWADTKGVERSLPRFHRTTRRWLRTAAQGADTAVWLSIAPDLALPSGAFAFDRAPAARHILPGTQASDAERTALWDEVQERATAPTAPR